MKTPSDGLEVTTTSQDVLDAYDRTLVSFFSFTNDLFEHMDKTVALDDTFVLIRLLKGYATMLYIASEPVQAGIKSN